MVTRKKVVVKATSTALLKVQSVTFEQPPFRKLGSLQIAIAPRVTLIAGRNGVGKSTILALIAGGSGITRGGGKLHTYFESLPNVGTEDILKLSFDRDFVKDEAQKANVLISYSYGDHSFQKRGNVSGSESRLRIVPRNEPKGELTLDDVTIPADGKVPIPTIYLGMTRVLPVGEAAPESLVFDETTAIDAEDYELYSDFVNQVISTGAAASGIVTSQYVRGTNKHSIHPEYGGYNSTNVSLGQDSLSAIATALASFKKLKRVMGNDYKGGLLIIDEIDAGFHPHAQIALLDELKSKARALGIQVIATTHSLTMLEYAHQDIYSDRKKGSPQDQIVYLKGGLPIELLDASNYDAIYADMHLKTIQAQRTPSIKIYLEDDEAALFLAAILTVSRRRKIKASTGYNLDVIPVRVGCGNLVGLLKADPYFHSVIFVLDADADSVRSGGALNVLRLPQDPAHSKKQSPEAILEAMCLALCSDANAYPKARAKLNKIAGTDYVDAYINKRQTGETKASKAVSEDREVAKAWFNVRRDKILEYKLIDGWVLDNEQGVNKFIDSLENAVKAVASGNIYPPKKLAKPKKKA
jgi:predicted ATPase